MAGRKRVPSTSETPDFSHKNKHAKPEEKASDSAPSLAPNTTILSLPTELIFLVVNLLPPDDYLRVKFVCKRLNAATQREDGTSTRNLAVMFDTFAEPLESMAVSALFTNCDRPMKSLRRICGRRIYATTMAALEAGLSNNTTYNKLTCTYCAKLVGRWEDGCGFDDKRFDKADIQRACIMCRYLFCKKSLCGVEDTAYTFCFACEHLKPHRRYSAHSVLVGDIWTGDHFSG